MKKNDFDYDIGFLESMGMHETLLCISFEEHLNYNLLFGIVGRCFLYLYVPTTLYIEISRKSQFFLIYERNEIKSLRFFFFSPTFF